MKKMKILILLMIIMSVFGCDKKYSSDGELRKSSYDGHEYIIYQGNNKGGLTHSASCKLCEGNKRGEKK